MNGSITIRKSLVGLLLIYLAGTVLFAVLFAAAVMNGLMTRSPLAMIYGSAAGFTLLATTVAAYVYRLSYIEMGSDGMTVVNYSTLFVARTAECAYRSIQDVDLMKPGLLAQLGNFGTLYVQTAGTERNLKLKWVPDAEKWTAYLLHQAEAAKVPVKA